LTEDLLDVLQLLAIRQRDLIWTHPEIETQQIRNALKNHLAFRQKPNPAFMRPVQPDDKLAAVVGSAPLPRSELTKKLWNYIKRRDLQDKKKRTMINADDSLRPVFNGKSQVSMFEMTKLVSKHLR
jgi:chromatin remodeling complex protein RSC6